MTRWPSTSLTNGRKHRSGNLQGRNRDYPRVRTWNGSFFEEENSSANVGVYRIIQGAEAPTRNEKIVCGITNGSTISAEIWDGSSWSGIISGPPVSESYWWGCGVAYERQSGDGVLVWNDNSQSAGNKLRYTVWNGSSWTTPASITAYTGGEPQHMHLAAMPGADQMVLVVNDGNADDYALVWDGSSWGNQVLLDSSGTGEGDQTALYVACENRGGRCLVLYGKDGDANAYYRIWDRTSWGSEQSVSPPGGITAEIQWITLGSDPSSNRIAMGVLTSGGAAAETWLNVWTALPGDI